MIKYPCTQCGEEFEPSIESKIIVFGGPGENLGSVMGVIYLCPDCAVKFDKNRQRLSYGLKPIF
jgi:phage terminase large subunit GpA-like protein